MKVLLTGATGFVGGAVLRRLRRDGHDVRAAVRRHPAALPPDVEQVEVGEIGPETSWHRAIAGADAVIHLAARVHVMRDAAADPLAEFRRVNTAGTACLAQAAAAAGVRRFVFLSSIKVNGESGRFSESSEPQPRDPYGMSKLEAEVALRAIARDGAMEPTIIRPPLVYGPGVRANFRALAQVVARGIPLPLGAVDNRRSLIAVDNLADFVVTCITHPAAGNETFLVSDGEDLSTRELVRRMGAALGRRARLVSVPPSLLFTAARMLRRQDVAQRLLGSLELDISKARTRLQWAPPVSVSDGLRVALRELAR